MFCERERATRELERVDVERNLEAGTFRTKHLRFDERDVPEGSVRDEHRAVEDARDVAGDLRERRRVREDLRAEPMHVDVADLAALRSHERVEALFEHTAAHAVDAHLDDAILPRVEAGHLQIDESERGFLEREI